MSKSIKKGIGFGLTSGTITILGVIVGLNSGTSDKAVVVSGILVIAIADALSDSLGIHISEESAGKKTREVWEATIATFISKFGFVALFVIPILFLPLAIAVKLCVALGLSLVAIFSAYIAKDQKVATYKVVFEHVFIAILVVIVTHLIGKEVQMLGIS